MKHLNNQITVNMILKNEDQWVWYALKSILPFADRVLITDTGSQDKTIEIIESINSPKIKLVKTIAQSSRDVTAARALQLEQTQTDWIWIVDGDEIYTNKLARECLEAIDNNYYEGIAVRRYDLLGDIYHKQIESVGQYNMFGQTGHLVTRFINKSKITGLHYKGDYPLEGWYDQDNNSTRDRDPKSWYITSNHLYHAMYLKRSSMGGNLNMFNRSKYKIEKGITIDDSLPEVFSEDRPTVIPDPLIRRSKGYEIISNIVTPIKNFKRKYL